MAGSKSNRKGKGLKVLDGLRHGPVSDEIIKDNSYHVSHEVWLGNDRGVLETIGGGRSRRWVVTDEMRLILAYFGFGVFGNPDVVLQKDAALISALVERWRAESNTFLLRPGEMTITLEDVGMILGLPLTGEAVTCGAFKDKFGYFITHWFEPLSRKEEKSGWIHGGISLRWLFDTYGRSEPPRERAMIHAKAYMLYILGTVLFPTTSRNCVHPRLLMLLQDNSRIRGYAWGPAVLAYLYRGLGAASMFRAKKFAACLLVLQIWAYERLLSGRPRRRPYSDMLIPLAEGWAYCSWRAVDDDRRSDGPHHDLDFYRGELDGAAGDVVEWTPYARFLDFDEDGDIIPESRYMGLGKVPLIYFDVVEYQFPDRVMGQFGFPPHIPPPPMDMSQYRRGMDSSFQVTDLRVKWHKEIRMWIRFCEDFIGMVEEYGAVSKADYRDWYARVSLFRVGKPQGTVKTGYQTRELFDNVEALGLIETAMGILQSLDKQIEPGVAPGFANMLPKFLELYTEFMKKLQGPTYTPPTFRHLSRDPEPRDPTPAPYSQHVMDITQPFSQMLTPDIPLVQPEVPVFDEGEESRRPKQSVRCPATSEKLLPSKVFVQWKRKLIDEEWGWNLAVVVRTIPLTHPDIHADVYPEALFSLKPGEWVDDRIMHVYMHLLKHREYRMFGTGEWQHRPIYYFMDNFFFDMADVHYKVDYTTLDSLQRWYASEARSKFFVDWCSQDFGHEIGDADFIFFPAHVQGNHWVLFVFSVRQWVVLVLDPANDDVDNYLAENYGEQYAIMEEFVPNMLRSVNPEGNYPLGNASCTAYASRPKQKNNADCGVYVMKYMDYLLQGYSLTKLKWTEAMAKNFRYRIAWEIRKGEARNISIPRMALRTRE